MRPEGDGLRCAYCGSLAFPEKNDEGVRLLGEAQGLTCPVCTVPLMDATLTGTQIRYCTTCHGMLVAMAAFADLLASARALPTTAMANPADGPSELQRSIHCPSCHGNMIADWYGGGGHVVIDSCDRCSLNWLDHGELLRIAHAPDSMADQTADASMTSRQW
jgi:Zn-finger nucleic acid-binding protein